MLIPKVDEASAGRFRVYLLPSPNFPSRTIENEGKEEVEGKNGEEAEEKKGGEAEEKKAKYHTYEGGLVLVWDRKVEGGFPEMRTLKQKVRDLINPSFGLGHSDKK